jgi:hypothetical protein
MASLMISTSLAGFSALWSRSKLEENKIVELEQQGLVERRRPKSQMLRLTRKGALVQARLLGENARASS